MHALGRLPLRRAVARAHRQQEAALTSLAPGTRFGPYEVTDRLGAGGMGEVYRARDPRLSREVAIKVLPPALAGDEDRLRRFRTEAEAAGLLNHPNIMAVYDVGTEAGMPYVVCELLEGETLGRRLSQGALPWRKAADVGAQIARGLAAAHERGIVHRDLKPDNLFITPDGRVKVLDFGLAKLTEREGDPLGTATETWHEPSVPNAIIGTVGYMSPEQAR
ncbi:MAG TPA: serine/threonine-protein kinase, partial [Vicinamibacteria bacterium]